MCPPQVYGIDYINFLWTIIIAKFQSLFFPSFQQVKINPYLNVNQKENKFWNFDWFLQADMTRKKNPLNLALPLFKIIMDCPLVKVMIKMEFAKCAPNLEHGWFGESVAKISPRWSHYIWDTSVARRQAWKSITLMHDDRRDEPPLLKTSFNATTLFMHACSTMTLKSLIHQLVDQFHCRSTKDLSILIDIIHYTIRYLVII